MDNISDYIKFVIDNSLKELLAEAGYSRKGNTFILKNKKVNVQSSQYNYKNFGRFIINLEIRKGKQVLRTRIGPHLLKGEKIEKWWSVNMNFFNKLRKESYLKGIANEVKEAWIKYGKPWMSQYK